ncbi:unannotated protein [freshwater metagenome]|uniref:Unannotated protein n=1 Tax=freshwater metagenome TaxID=449393 RepID=A0A6J7J2U8_9ZZZZ
MCSTSVSMVSDIVDMNRSPSERQKDLTAHRWYSMEVWAVGQRMKAER